MSPNVALSVPTSAFRDSYRALVREIHSRNEKLVPFVLSFEHDDFDGMLRRLADCARGIGLPRGFVPHSTFWLIENDSDVVGVVNIRHSLTPALRKEGGNIGYGIRPCARSRGLGKLILARSLDEAKRLGSSEVLLTCAKDNIASAQVILANGGVLESEEYLEQRGELVQRYVIPVRR
jgi:predicted acetyltransferase